MKRSILIFIVVSVLATCVKAGEARSAPEFNRQAWMHNRPATACNYIKKELKNKSKSDVLTLLGKPDAETSAGTGMWGHYDAFYSYSLDKRPKSTRNRVTWKTLDISFSTSGIVSKIEIQSHRY